MALPLSPNIAKTIEKLFPDENKDEVVRLLTEKCADNLPNMEHDNEFGIEDLRFQVLKQSDGNIEKLREAVRIANLDWRDLDGSVGSVRKYKRKLLGDALERNVESDEVFYAQRWGIFIASAAFTSIFILRLVSASSLTIVCVFLSIAVIYPAGLLVVPRLFGGKPLYEGMSYVFRIQVSFLAVLTFVGVSAALGFFIAYAIQYFF